MSESWVAAEDITKVEELVERALVYMPAEEAHRLKDVYEFAKKAHEGQMRKSGEPYITHPLAVSGILAALKLDFATVATGLLHDTVEDTEVTLKDVEDLFGPSVSFLVDGVTKISKINFKNTQEKQGENVRKMIVSMGRDVRVILVKLCDRLHNMRTLKHMRPDKQERIANETLDIYAPLASRLGINWLKVELEDLSFRYSNPSAFYDLVEKVKKKKKERQAFIQNFKARLQTVISKDFKKEFEVQGRPKHLYSIHKKMIGGLDYDQIYDVLAFRILVDSVPQCYELLGLVHSQWRPVPGRFKDFIAMPKNNNYQSLHTTIISAEGERIEIQIRTHEMHLVAEQGIAAHWGYKQGGADEDAIEKFNWLRELVSMHQQMEDSSEFLEGVKTDLFENEIYVFTPRGELKELPEGATPIDFAYSIHTDLGAKCVGARVNGKMVSFKHKLKNGDYVEVLTSNSQTPSKDWLKFCVTTKAKSKIRYFIKNEQRKRALEIGEGLVEKVFKGTGVTPANYVKKNQAHMDSVFKDLGCGNLDELKILLGYGKVYPKMVAEKIFGELNKEEPKEEAGLIQRAFKKAAHTKKKSRSLVTVDGMSDVLVHFAKCCHPIPGDDIISFITRGRGIVVHRADCPKTHDLDSDREVDVRWGNVNQEATRLVKIRVLTYDQRGMLNRITEIFSAKGLDLHNAEINVTRDKKVIAYFSIYIRDSDQLYGLFTDIKKLKEVIEIKRV